MPVCPYCRPCARLEPDLLLLDGGDAAGYGQSWETAAWLHARNRPIPTIMFTGHSHELAEARLGDSDRSQRAACVGLMGKPFDLDSLIDLVVGVVEHTRVISEAPNVRQQISRVAAMHV